MVLPDRRFGLYFYGASGDGRAVPCRLNGHRSCAADRKIEKEGNITMAKPQVSPPKGLMPSLQWAPLDLLALDHSYQRGADNLASKRLIRSIARDWNWDMCLPLIAARRPGVVEFFVVDGQHRLAGARLRN